MATISTQLRKFKEPTREELTRRFFALPPGDEQDNDAEPQQSSSGSPPPTSGNGEEKGEMEINAVLSLGIEGIEDSYVCACVNQRDFLF